MKNVILLTIDTLRQDALGCYGNQQNLTPFIDSIQNHCIRFEKAQSLGPYTQASFPGILTSSYYLEYGYGKDKKKLSPYRRLISEALKSKGFVTAGLHSNAYLCNFFGWNRGWDTFYDGMDVEVTEKMPFIEAPALNKKVLSWLSTQSSENPFFLWVHYMDVHEPYVPPKKYLELVDPDLDLDEDIMFSLFKNVLLKRDTSNPRQIELLKKLYLAGVRKVDDSTKELFDMVDRVGFLENTVIILTADHGDEFNEHGGLSHDGKMYRELIDIPLIIYDPSLSKGVTCDKLVSTLDVAPTIIHLFGLEPEDRFEGQSLLPVESIQDRGVFGEATDKHGSSEQTDDKEVHYYREGDIKIIYYERTDTWEMYDLRQDPKELNNIISNFPAVAGPMKEKILPRVARWNK